MNIFTKLKSTIRAESYLFSLMLRTSGFIGLIIVLFNLIDRLWWNIVSPFIEKYLLDELVGIYTSKTITNAVFLLIGAQLGGKVLNNLLAAVSGILQEYTQNKATLHLDKEVMHRVADMDAAFFDNPQNRDAIRVANQSKAIVSENIGWSVSMVTSVVGFIASVSVFLTMNPLLGILFLATYIPGTVIDNKNRKNMRSFSIDSVPENRKKDYYRSLLTSAGTAKDVRLYNLADYFKGIYKNLWIDIRRKRYEIFKKGAVQSFSVSLLTTVGIIVIIIYSVCSVIDNTMTIGDMSLYISLALSTGSSFGMMLNQVIGHLRYCVPEVNNFIKFMDYENEIKYSSTKETPESPTIEFRNVSFRYPGSDNYVLKNISFKMEYGEKIALLGINGSGKTTLVKLLLRFYIPESGEILINRIDVCEYSKEAYSKIFGTCFQDINRYALSMRENIALSRIDKRENDAAVEQAAGASGADRIAAGLENKYDTDLTREFNDNGAELSGGQWQKIAIARAFFSDAPVIILDEPSSALDPEAEDEIFRSFKKLCENKSGILISHRLSSSMLVDKIVLIENGELLETGTHEELIAKNGRYAELYKMQAEKYKAGKENA